VSLYVSLIGAAGIALWVIALGKTQKIRDPNTMGQLKCRLSGYAVLKSADSQECGPDAVHLPACQHEVLLGTLKKVETKNAALIQAWALFLTATVGLAAVSLSNVDASESGYFRLVLLTLVFLALPFLFAALRGMKQLDQYSFRRLRCGGSLEGQLPVRMQDGLLQDLLVKEACFRFSLCGAYAYVVAFAFLIGAILAVTAGAI
jgi:hypothetical protein